jgi:hypothetical protein
MQHPSRAAASAIMSAHQPASPSSIPFEFRAEHPANPFHAIDTREAEYGPDAAHEKPGAIREELQRLVWVKTSEWTDAGHWEAHTASEIRKIAEEQRVKQLKRQQSTQAVPKKKKSKRRKAVNNESPDESGQVNPDPNPAMMIEATALDPNVGTSNPSTKDPMHPDRVDRVKKRAKRPGFKGTTPPHILEYIQTPYAHTTPEFIRNLEPVVDRPRKSARPAPTNLPYPYPWPDIHLSARRDDPAGELNTTTFQLRGREKIFHGFFDISKEQAELRERARQAGQSSWRFTGKEKIVEVFFNIDLDKEKGSVHGTPMAQALQDAEGYEELPFDKSYLAVDKNLVPIVAFYHNAYEQAWGKDYGRYIVKMSTENIDKFARFVKPSQKMDTRRHTGYQAWIEEEENQQFSWANGPDARSTIYYFGLKGEQGHPHQKSILSKDLQPISSYRGSMARNLQVWCGNITQTLDACFAGVDRTLRDAYRQTFASNKNVGDRKAAETFDEELFAYQALLINVLTELHVDQEDWKKGWAWLTPFGDYIGGLFCIPLLQRKIPFQPGSVLGLRGERVEHFTTKWRGSNRYSWVFTFPEQLRKYGC